MATVYILIIVHTAIIFDINNNKKNVIFLLWLDLNVYVEEKQAFTILHLTFLYRTQESNEKIN